MLLARVDSARASEVEGAASSVNIVKLSVERLGIFFSVGLYKLSVSLARLSGSDLALSRVS